MTTTTDTAARDVLVAERRAKLTEITQLLSQAETLGGECDVLDRRIAQIESAGCYARGTSFLPRGELKQRVWELRAFVGIWLG